MTAAISGQPAAQLTVRREISAGADELFDAFLDPESLSDIMHPGSDRRADVTNDARVGGAFEINMHANGQIVQHTGEYREIDRPRKLVFTWNSKSTNHQETVVTIHFHPIPGKETRTEVILTQVLLPESQIKGHIGGWTRIIELLDERFGQKA